MRIIAIDKKCVSAMLVCALGLAGCAGTKTSSYAYNESLKVNAPAKADNCYDASVLLAQKPEQAKETALRVLTAIDAKTTKTTYTYIEAERQRHVGLFVGSGGEELVLNFKAVGSDKTFVTVTTKTGFVGGAGQKAWSCKIVDELVTMSAR